MVFNKALALQEQHRKNKEKMPRYAALCKLLTAWRHAPETLWLAEAPAQALQQALKDLDRAWTNCFLAPLSSFKQHENALRKAQQSLSRKVKLSKNWQKAKVKVQRLHARIACVRRDFLHKATSLISKNHALVFVEDLQVRNMSRSAKGTKEAPGKRVKAKAGLNRAILDQGWYEFRRQLAYKLEWLGGKLFAVPPQYSSQTCPECGHIAKENRRTQASFVCV